MLIQKEMHNKIQYLHSRFESTEWSGPAWYTIKKKTKQGFPTKVELEYFKPIDLGNTGSTELDGEKLGKVLPAIYKKFPKLKKSFMGLIHSHHNMGAFFSGTDESTALEQAPVEGLFFTTVVAHNKDKYATGVSYRDQYGLPNFIEGEVESKVVTIIGKGWKSEADKIEKEAKPTYTNNYNINGYGRYYGQGNIWASKEAASDKETDKKKSDSIGNTSIEASIPLVQETELMLATQIYDKLLEMEITEVQFTSAMKEKCPNVDPYLFASGYYDQI